MTSQDNDFRIGDRVRCTSKTSPFLHGLTGTVVPCPAEYISVWPVHTWVKLDNDPDAISTLDNKGVRHWPRNDGFLERAPIEIGGWVRHKHVANSVALNVIDIRNDHAWIVKGNRAITFPLTDLVGVIDQIETYDNWRDAPMTAERYAQYPLTDRLTFAARMSSASAEMCKLMDEAATVMNDQTAQITKLAEFIMHEIPGKQSADEGAVDTAIRIIRDLQNNQAVYDKAVRLLSVIDKTHFGGKTTPAATTSGVLDQIDHLTVHMDRLTRLADFLRSNYGSNVKPNEMSPIDTAIRIMREQQIAIAEAGRLMRSPTARTGNTIDVWLEAYAPKPKPEPLKRGEKVRYLGTFDSEIAKFKVGRIVTEPDENSAEVMFFAGIVPYFKTCSLINLERVE